mmetsp:Transcript_52042/g.97351  ORF Transcript_52042/g.97351 Transcript_52042/m.97351 type:complete len:122 (+) Transcript_52042:51-416(+)
MAATKVTKVKGRILMSLLRPEDIYPIWLPGICRTEHKPGSTSFPGRVGMQSQEKTRACVQVHQPNGSLSVQVRALKMAQRVPLAGAFSLLVGAGKGTCTPPENITGLYSSGTLLCITGLFR